MVRSTDVVLEGWTEEAERGFEDAIKLRNRGLYAEARMVGRAAVATLRPGQDRARAAIVREIGFTHQMEGDLEAALACYLEARDLRPTSELSSLCVFHTLYQLGRRGEAIVEALRFSRLRLAPDYLDMFTVGFADDLSDYERVLADAVRAELHDRERHARSS